MDLSYSELSLPSVWKVLSYREEMSLYIKGRGGLLLICTELSVAQVRITVSYREGSSL